MKICFIVGTLGRGGAEKQLVYMLRALKENAIAARVLCLTRGEDHEDDIRSLGVPVEWVGESENRVARLLKIVSSLRKDPADIVQSSHFYTNIYAGLAGKALRIPSIGAVRNNLTSEIQIHGFLGRWQVVLPSFLIINSALAHKRAIEQGIPFNKTGFVRNVVETESPESEKDPKIGSNLTLLFVGRLGDQKRPERFVRLAENLSEKFPEHNLKFRIVGDGEQKSELVKQAEAAGLLPGKLEFLGVRKNMDEVYRQADILVSTSDFEGSPNVVLEAMAYGLPVIATNVGGTPEILDDSRGILVEPGSERELLGAAEKLIMNGDLRCRLGKAGKKYVAENHSFKYLRERLDEIYKNLIMN